MLCNGKREARHAFFVADAGHGRLIHRRRKTCGPERTAACNAGHITSHGDHLRLQFEHVETSRSHAIRRMRRIEVGFLENLLRCARSRKRAAALRSYARGESLCQLIGGAISATGPGFGTTIFLVSTGASLLSSSRNLSKTPWIDVFTLSGPRSLISVC